MTAKDKKLYLQQAYKLNKHIGSLIRERESIQLLRERCMKVTPNYENDGTQNGANSNGTENNLVNYISKLQEYESEITTDIDKYVDIKRRIKQIIMLVPNHAEQQILIKRYINFEQWEQISYEMNYTYRHTLRRHNEAIEKMSLDVTIL